MVKKLFSTVNSNDSINDFALLFLRLSAGLTMAFAHGLGKMPPPEMLVQGVGAMGFPMPELFAWLAGLSEFLGGLFLAIGLLTRPAAFFMAITMGVAAFVVHAADPFVKKEMALLYLFISAFFAIRGAGKFSVDRFICKK